LTNGEIIKVLEQLGLTEYEAKTMNALFKLKEAEAPEVSRSAQVPKTRVYDVLDRLTKRGLIIEIYGRPKKYRTVEAEGVFNELISRKKKELDGLEAKASQIKLSFDSPRKGDTAEKVMKVKDKFDFMRILAQEIDSANESVIAFTGLGDSHKFLKSPIVNAAGKNVDVRLMSKLSKDEAKLAKEYSESGISLKDFDHGMHAYVIDGKKVIMALSDFAQDKPEYHFTIWPDNRPMAKLLQNHFDQCWKKAK